jgi:hypothetical protein
MNYRLVALGISAGLSGCGTTPDDRPVTFEVVTLEILAPSCGQVQCHSTATNLKGYAFDTLAGSRAALQQLVGPGGGGGRRRNNLIQVLTSTGGKRMPPDAPLAAQDIELVQAWLDAGNPGL